MKRLVAPLAALVLAAVAVYALVTWRVSQGESVVHGDTDETSRRRLEGVIESERGERGP